MSILGEPYEIVEGVYITGTLIWYYKICKREVWLMARHLEPYHHDPLLELGRAIHETSYESLSKEIKLEGVKFDIYLKGKRTVCEIKTSSKFLEAATFQVKYYLYRLRDMGIKARGVVLVPREKKRYKISLDEDSIKELEEAFNDIRNIVSMEVPPPPKRIPFCRRCAYRDFCWV